MKNDLLNRILKFLGFADSAYDSAENWDMQKDVADLFDVAAIPLALAATGEGKIFGRLRGFMEPELFEKEIASWRESLR